MSKTYLTSKDFIYGTDEWFAAGKQIGRRNYQLQASRKRAKKYGVKNTLTMKQLIEVFIASEGICFYCGKYFGVEKLSIDHYIPFFHGGENTKENIIPSCELCNFKKNKTMPDLSIILYQHQPIA